MRLNHSAALIVSFIAIVNSAQAGDIVFNVNLPIGNGSVTGTITTDGTLGVIGLSDITGLNLTIDGPHGSAVATSPFDFYAFSGNDLSETASELMFNYSGSSGAGFTLLSDGPDYSEAWTTGGSAFVNSICGNINCDPDNVPELELDSRAAPAYYTDETGDVVIGSAVPEPDALFLFATGLIGIGAMRTRLGRRFRKEK